MKPGKREPGGIFSNSITFPNGCEILLETTNSSSSDDWRLQALRKYGDHISGIAFEVRDLDSLYGLMSMAHLPLSMMDSLRNVRSDSTVYSEKIFGLGGCAPLDVVFYSADTASRILPKPDSLSHHRNGVFRFDWVLLSAAPEVEARMRIVFDIINGWKQHEGCCDFWRVGPSNDFCFFRFDPPPKKAKASSDWLSIEPDAIYFAY
ncbi:MAG: hypothetical protein Q8916_01560 [Bacteroidota bacterium]|nr:hypothetical protein [Bacteroidota bacterium]MDP4229073.1 hypothetical protein [Bacteroidota bacterium]MDP4237234.1 hypothetical protein [Bacteroidota bacterium]